MNDNTIFKKLEFFREELWNVYLWRISKKNECPILGNDFSDWMYFVHSYSACPIEQKNIVATTKFGTKAISSMVWHKNTGACQFHPEKSGIAGQLLLLNWINWLKKSKY